MKMKSCDFETELKRKLCEGIGQASMCWSETPKGIFDSTQALKIVDQLYSDIIFMRLEEWMEVATGEIDKKFEKDIL